MYSQAPDLTDAEAEAGGRVAEALKHLGLKGPLDLAEDALTAMDYLVSCLIAERTWRTELVEKDWAPFAPPATCNECARANVAPCPHVLAAPADLAAVNADLRRQLASVEAVALELIAERDRAVEELGRLQQLSLLAEPA